MSKKRARPAGTVTALARRVEEQARRLAVAQGVTGDATGMFERLARDPKVPVEKLEKLIALQERITAFNAKAAFEAAFSVMQGEIPEVDRRGRIVATSRKTGSTRTTPYAKNEDIQVAVRPILARHGFALSFRTEWPAPGKIRIVGRLGHRDGHSEESSFEAGPDQSGDKNDVQALGSTISYGHRYTTQDLLNITSRGQDTDAHPPGRQEHDAMPDAHNASSDEPITADQRKRFWAILHNSGRTEKEVRAWLAVAYDIGSTRDITRANYETICAALEAPGNLPPGPNVVADREPGEEG